MHEQKNTQSDPKNPYIQIMFNINSRNVVNNNILTERQKQLKLSIPHQLKPQKIDKTFIFPQKKQNDQQKLKSKKSNIDKSQFSSFRIEDLSSQENYKKKRLPKTSKNNLTGTQTQRSTKNVKPKRKVSEGLTKPHTLQQGPLSSGRVSSYTKTNLKTNRQKIIQLMIKDYQKGIISPQNFKDVISSLIDKQSLDRRVGNKSQIKTQKSKTHFTNTYKNSAATSLRNTPKNVPKKSKSEKFYHPQVSSNFRVAQIEQLNQPEIIQRVIDRKQFINKIIIKGINSSLFLSNQYTDKQSPTIRQPVRTIIINTSESVKQLRKQMQRSIKKTTKSRSQPKMQQNQSNNFNVYENLQNEAALKIQKAWKNFQTGKIVKHIIEQINLHDHNLKIHETKLNFNENNLKQDISQNSLNFLSQNQYHPNISNQLNNMQDQEQQFNELYIRQDMDSSQHQLKIQQLQKQYALMLVGNNNQSHNLRSGQYYINNIKQEENDIQNVQTKRLSKLQHRYKHQFNMKSYVSSELQISLNHLVSISKMQQIKQKRVKIIQQTQMKKLNQILEVVKEKLQGKNDKKQVLMNIIQLLERQKNTAQKQLKIYNMGNMANQRKNSEQRRTSHVQMYEGGVIDQNQMINSFKKKLKKKNLFNVAQQHQRSSKIHYQSQDLKSSISSSSSFSRFSIFSSNHLQKTKISELNLDQIEIGLQKHLKNIQLKKQEQICLITEKFINEKITPKQYHEQKAIIEKWFKLETIELRRTKKSLVEGYRKVNEFLFKGQFDYSIKMTRQKSTKMIKCISEKYLEKNRLQNQQLSKDKQQKSFPKQQKNKKSQRIFQNQNHNLQLQPKQNLKNKLSIPPKHKQQTEPSPIQQQKIQQYNLQHNNLLISPILQSIPFPVTKTHLIQPSCYNQQGNQQNEQMIQSGKFCQVNQYQDEQQLALVQPQVMKMKSQISQFLDKYQTQNNENNEDQQQQGYENYECEEQYDYKEQQNQSEGPINSQSQQQSIQRSESLKTQQDDQHTQSANIIINKKSSQKDNQLLFPKKLKNCEQFSQQLLQYNQLNQGSQIFSENRQIGGLDDNLNQSLNKLKQINQEDLDDIFQFIFLDMCLELFLQQTKNNKIMRAIEKHLICLRKKKNTPKGFKTALSSCRNYIQNFSQFVKSHYFTTLRRLQSPMGPSAQEMLKFMRQYEDSSSQHSSTQGINLILPIQIYEKYQKLPVNRLQVQRYYDENEKQQPRLKFLNSLKHFHNKAIFDSLNQCLDLERNYQIWGKPFPWKKIICIDRHFSDDQIKDKLQKSCQKVIQNCSYLCGVLLDKEDSVFGKNKVSQEYLRHVREDRMSKMLSNQMLDNQERWIFYDDQQTEVLVSITKFITGKLLNQVVKQILDLSLGKE